MALPSKGNHSVVMEHFIVCRKPGALRPVTNATIKSLTDNTYKYQVFYIVLTKKAIGLAG